MNSLTKTILWILAGVIIISTLKTIFQISGLASLIVSVVMWIFFFKIYIKYIPNKWK